MQPANDASGQLTDNSGSISANVPNDSDSTVTSSDGLASVTFPKGTFGKDAYCAVDNGDSSNVPLKKAKTVGPYSIDCTDADGNPLTEFKKAVSVSLTLPAGNAKYAAYANDTKWQTVASTKSGHNLNFKLAKADLFAGAAKKTTGFGVILVDAGAVLAFLIIIVLVVRLIKRRQTLDAPPDAGNYDQNYMSQ